MADLSSTLAAITLDPSAPTRYHVLHMSYPVLHLLPIGVEPYLDPPKDQVHRERPRLGLYHLSSSNLSFFHRFPVGSAAAGVSLSVPNVDTGSADFLAAINALGAAPGESHLEFASFDSHETGIQHILRLTVNDSNDQNAANANATQYNFQLSDDQLTSLFFPSVANGPNSWLNLMSDLVHRTSDRAVLHVQHQLSTNPAFTSRDDSIYADKWDTEPSPPGYQALMSRLTTQLPDGSTIALSDLDTENLAAHAQRNIPVHLPCGHNQAFCYERLRALTDNTSLHAECRACNQRILSYEQTVALLNRIERTARDNFYWEEVDLHVLDGPVATRGPKMEVSVHEVCYVLEDILQGLEVPESATPLALSLVHAPETQAVLLGLQRELRSSGGNFESHDGGAFGRVSGANHEELA